MIKLFLLVLLSFTLSCSTDVSGPVDDFPNFVKINVENEPLVGGTKIYVVKPDFVPSNQKYELNVLDTITDNKSMARFDMSVSDTNYNLIAVNGIYGAFIKNIKFNRNSFDTTIKLQKMGVVSFNTKSQSKLYVSIKGTPFSDSVSNKGFLMLPKGVYDIVYDTTNKFKNPIKLDEFNVASDTVILNRLLYPDENAKIDFILPNYDSVMWNNMFLKTGGSNILMWPTDQFDVAGRYDFFKKKIDSEDSSNNIIFSYFTGLPYPSLFNSEISNNEILGDFISSWKYFLEKHALDSCNVIVEPRIIGKIAEMVLNDTISNQSFMSDSVLSNFGLSDLKKDGIARFVELIFSLKYDIAPKLKLGFFINDEIVPFQTEHYINSNESVYSLAKYWSDAVAKCGVSPDFVVIGELNTDIDNMEMYNNLSDDQFGIMVDLAKLLESRFNIVYFIDMPIVNGELLVGTGQYNFKIANYFLSNLSFMFGLNLKDLWFSGFQNNDISF